MKKLKLENRMWWNGGFLLPFVWAEELLLRAGIVEEIPPVNAAAFEEAE